MSDGPGAPVEPGGWPTEDGADDLNDEDADGPVDPWPAWCERAAMALDVGAACLIAGAILVAIR